MASRHTPTPEACWSRYPVSTTVPRLALYPSTASPRILVFKARAMIAHDLETGRELWRQGEYIRLPLRPETVRATYRHRMVLTP